MREASRGRRVVEAATIGQVVLKTAQNAQIARSKLLHEGCDARGVQLLEQEIACQVAAHCDHTIDELAPRAWPTDAGIEVLLGIVFLTKRVRNAIHEALELVANQQGVVEGYCAEMRLAVGLHHDANLHGAGGMERMIGVNQELFTIRKMARGKADIRSPAVADNRL